MRSFDKQWHFVEAHEDNEQSDASRKQQKFFAIPLGADLKELIIFIRLNIISLSMKSKTC